MFTYALILPTCANAIAFKAVGVEMRKRSKP